MNISFALDQFSQNYPNASRFLQGNLKIYKDVERFGDVRWSYLNFANAIAYGTNETKKEKSDWRLDDQQILAMADLGLQHKHNYPTFFVERKLLEAVLMTDISHIIDCSQMRMPFESFTFVLPKINPYSIDCIRVSRITPDSQWFTKKWKFSDTSFSKKITTLFCITCFRADKTILQTRLFQKFDLRNYLEKGIDPQCSPDERIVTEKLPVIVFNLLFAMAARPELIETGRKLGRHKKSNSEIWSPNTIGRKYTVKRPEGYEPNSEHGTKRLHWRRGHFRNQPYGKGRVETKIIWLEPTLIGVKSVAV